MNPPFRILHMSDLHFGEKSHYGQSDQQGQLMMEIDLALIQANMITPPRRGPYFDAVILSGDFSWQGNPNGFASAKTFIDLLEKQEYCSRSSILIIPGNHDISFFRNGQKEWIEEEVERPYRDFVRDITGKETNKFLARIKEFRNRGIVLAGLNSSRIIRDEADELGFIGYDQFFAVINEIWKSRSPAAKGNDELLIVFLHHHLSQIDSIQPREWTRKGAKRRYSFTLDAPAVVKAMREANVQLVLHGHQHLPWLLLDQSGNPLSFGAALPVPLLISAAGSAGICYPDSRDKHHFQIIEIAHDRASLKLHHFSADAKKKIPRQWQHQKMDAMPLKRFRIQHPGQSRWQQMNGHSLFSRSVYERERNSWLGKQLLGHKHPGWVELRERLMVLWEDGFSRGALPAVLRDRSEFERRLDSTISALDSDPAALSEYESLLDTGMALSFDQFVLSRCKD